MDSYDSSHSRRLSRRDFVTQAVGAAAVTAAAPAIASAAHPILGANETIGLGFIGIGIRGEILLRAAQAIGGARVVQVCDLYDGHVARARDLCGADLAATPDYQAVLANPAVDAVVIAVPDHWHTPMTVDALAAGKDVFLEKPMTHRWEEGETLAQAVKTHKKILMVGSQYESMPANAKAAEVISSGRIGQVTLVSGAIHRNTATGAWYYPIPPDASPETIDWPRFLGPAQKRPFDAKRFFQWRLFWDYSGGLPTDLFVHLVTGLHAILGPAADKGPMRMPTRVMALGGIYRWKDREVPDQMSALIDYPGLAVSLTSTANNNQPFPLLTFMGTEGTLEYHGTRLVLAPQPPLENYTYATNSWPAATKQRFAELNDLDPQSMRPRATASFKTPPPETIETPGPDSTQAHLAKFFDAVRTRKEPVENVAFGHAAATVGHMINLSYRSGGPVRWDGNGGKVIT